MNRTVLTILATVFGLQSIRAFLPLLVYVLRDRFGLSSVPLGGIAFILFLLVLPCGRLLNRLSPGRATALAALALMASRGMLQIWPGDPVGSLVFAGAGVVAFFLFLISRLRDPLPTSRLSILAGALADASIHAAAGTRDLHWGGPLSNVVALVLIVVAAVALRRMAKTTASAPGEVGPGSERSEAPAPDIGRGMAAFVWGPFLFLHLEILGNVARLSSRLDTPTAHSGAIIGAGLAIALLAANATAGRSLSRAATLAVGAVLIGAVAFSGTTGALAIPSLLLAQVAAAVLLTAGGSQGGGRPSIGPFVAGFLAFLALTFVHYAGYDLALPVGRIHVFVLGAILMVASASLGSRDRSMGRAAPAPEVSAGPGLRMRFRTPVALAMGAAAILVPLARRPAPAQPTPLGREIRVVTFNLHNGFDELGGWALEEMLAALSAEEPNVIALQEVSRGWLVNGSADLFELARETLHLEGVAGPCIATDWGSAVFTTGPIGASRTVPLPPRDLPLPRSVTVVEVGRDSGPPLQVLATHYHHLEPDERIREEHSAFLVRTFPEDRRETGAPAILLGDFNAPPHSASIRTLREAGWHDVAESRDPASTYPANHPSRRIDTVLHDVTTTTLGSFVAPPWGSDHRAVVADLLLPASRTP